MFMIRNKETGQIVPLFAEGQHAHPSWAHEQCGTGSESDLKLTIDHLDVGDFVRQGGAENAFGVFLEVPNGALAWKRADPFQPARWIFDEEDLVEAAELDPEIVVRVPDEA
jgi:hypothetical protein